MSTHVYLDHAATTPVRPEVVEAMLPFLHARFGNPSSTHRWGREARTALDDARERLASCLGAQPDEVTFTAGGTESDNLALLGLFRARADGRSAVVVSGVEHKAILGAAHQAGHEGATERVIPVTRHGVVEPEALAATIGTDAAVASVMWVNNEIGVIQPIDALAGIARERGVLFHTDAVQGFGKIPLHWADAGVDALTISGHKFGAPKGIGALAVRRGIPIAPLVHGGTQERGRRPGTESVAMCVALARAAELAIEEMRAAARQAAATRDALVTLLRHRLPDLVIHGEGADRTPYIVSMSVPGTDSESLLMGLDLRGIAASSGSACQSGSVTPSHVLSAMGIAPDLAAGAIRFSFGALSRAEDMPAVAEALHATVTQTRQAARSAHA